MTYKRRDTKRAPLKTPGAYVHVEVHGVRAGLHVDDDADRVEVEEIHGTGQSPAERFFRVAAAKAGQVRRDDGADRRRADGRDALRLAEAAEEAEDAEGDVTAVQHGISCSRRAFSFLPSPPKLEGGSGAARARVYAL